VALRLGSIAADRQPEKRKAAQTLHLRGSLLPFLLNVARIVARTLR
jgi:hypothetical protein